MNRPLLSIENLSIAFEVQEQRGWLSNRVEKVEVVSSVDLVARSGEIVGIVGESGCGKSSLLRGILGSIPISGGEIYLEDRPLQSYSHKERARFMQLIFQDANASLNPKFNAFELISEPLEVLSTPRLPSKEVRERTYEYMELVGLPEKFASHYPHQFSGGQAQRVAIARAIITSPKMILCDEPLAALDISIQAQIVNLFRELNKKLGLSILLVSHDLGVVRYLSDRVYGFYLGQVVESGRAGEVFEGGLHPYMNGLLECIPKLDPRIKQFDRAPALQGEIPSIRHRFSGCRFASRCPWVLEACKERPVPLITINSEDSENAPEPYEEQQVRCIRVTEKNWRQKLEKARMRSSSKSQVSHK